MVGLSAAVLRTSSCEVLALTDATFCKLDASKLATLFRRHPALAFSILDARLREQERADARLTALGRMGAGERIAHLLLELREQLERRGMCEGKSIPFPLQRMQLADAVGLSRVHVMRALRELRRIGLVSLARRRLTIPDVHKLGRYCGYRTALRRRACAVL